MALQEEVRKSVIFCFLLSSLRHVILGTIDLVPLILGGQDGGPWSTPIPTMFPLRVYLAQPRLSCFGEQEEAQCQLPGGETHTGNEDRLIKNQGKLVGAAAMLADKGRLQLSQPKEVPFMWGAWVSPLSIPSSLGAELAFLGHWPPSEDAMGSFACKPCRMTLASPRLKKGVLGAAGSPYGKLPACPIEEQPQCIKPRVGVPPAGQPHCS